ncbi:hypothetical protein KQI41_17120 [Tissierella pigra]|uniref:YitT family protein n=1 Tax=Tissierella pigra TaxID=2607614 RepID=A0A6N7XWZ5_9FIRM|nr:DUF6198 family protein [Tissierella pigra]MBU5428117.1 hypothetical protein [Tissierella pigra]MSU01973.1 hypothetical protein [Tissierella pigra]
MKKFIIRFSLYIVGLFTLAIGIALSLRSNLGVSPVTSIPSVFSQISGKSVGTTTFLFYSICVVLQIIILKKDYKLKDLLQVGFSSVFGVFTDIALYLFQGLSVTNYLGKILLLVLSLVVVSIGLFLILTSDIVINAPEGLCIAISKKWNVAFSKVKSSFDIFCVILSLGVSLLVFGNLGQIREGTIIAALSIGRITGFIMNRYSKKLKGLYS